MSDPITTTANRVKEGGYWCEDATAITQAALDKYGLDWNTEIPLTWGIDALGLANTLLALGSVRPRFQSRADAITVRMMRTLYSTAAELGLRLGFTFTPVGHWLGNPARRESCKTQNAMWLDLSRTMTKPAEKSIADALAILFSDEPNHIACVHASKHLLAAVLQLDGTEAAIAARLELLNYLKGALENG